MNGSVIHDCMLPVILPNLQAECDFCLVSLVRYACTMYELYYLAIIELKIIDLTLV